MKVRFLFLAFLLIADAQAFGASALQTAAEALAPGQWATINGVTGINLFDTDNGTSLESANKGTWDPTRRQMRFCGTSHQGGSYYNKCLVYDEATNEILQFSLPPGMAYGPNDSQAFNFGHAYDHQTFDTLRGYYYHRTQHYISKFNPGTNAWLAQSSDMVPSVCGDSVATAEVLEYFPDVDRVYFISPNCDGQNFTVYNPNNNSWSQPSVTGRFTPGGIHGEGAYSKQGFIYAGGGNDTGTAISRIRSTQTTVQDMAAAPAAINVLQYSNLVGDPASGRILLFPAGGTIRELNPCPTKPCSGSAGGSWSDTGVTANAFPGRNIVIPISNYGVVMMVRQISQGNNQMLIYKHKTQATGDFIARTDLPGTIYANGFDTAGDLGTEGSGNLVGYGTYGGGTTCATAPCPTIVSASPASGAGNLKFTIGPGNNGAAAGNWWANWCASLANTSGCQFGAGQTFYVQMRQRWNANFLNAGTIFKVNWIATAGDNDGCTPSTSSNGALCKTSCTEIELVTQQDPQWNRFPTNYSKCPGSKPVIGFETAFPTSPYGTDDFKRQLGRPSPYCTKNLAVNGTQFTVGNCFGFFPDEWMTFSYKVSAGTRGNGSSPGQECDTTTSNMTSCYYGNDVWMRMGRNGLPTELVNTWTGPISAGQLAESLKFGKTWLTPYSGSDTFASGGTAEYDELIVSAELIPDPGQIAVSTSPVVSITPPAANPTPNSSITLTGSCTDDVGCTSVTWQNLQGSSGTASLVAGVFTTTPITLALGANTIIVTGNDAQSNTGQAQLIVTYTPASTASKIKLSVPLRFGTQQ